MTHKDKERVIIFRRLIIANKNYASLSKLKDEALLELLNLTIIPNSKSNNILYFTFTYNFILNTNGENRDKDKKISHIKTLINSLTKTEKDIIKFGLNKGFDSDNQEYQLSRFINESSLIEKGEFKLPKIVPQKLFSRIFPFAFNLIKKGEKNGRYPRI